MKKGFLLFILILFFVCGSLGVAVVSEAKDKLSKQDEQILEEFDLSFKNSADGRFQTTKMDDTSILIIDTRLGHLWILQTTPKPLIRYAGKVRPGTSFWGTTYKRD